MDNHAISLVIRCADGSETSVGFDVLNSFSDLTSTCSELIRDAPPSSSTPILDLGRFVPNAPALVALFEHTNGDVSFETVLQIADALCMTPEWYIASRNTMNERSIRDADMLLPLFRRNTDAVRTWPAMMATAWKGASAHERWTTYSEYPDLVMGFVRQRPREGAELLVSASPSTAVLLLVAASNMAVWHALWLRAVANIADADVHALATLQNRQWLFDRDFASSVRSVAMRAGIAAGAVPRFTHGSCVYDNDVRIMLVHQPKERIARIIDYERENHIGDPQLFRQMLRVADSIFESDALIIILSCKYCHILQTTPHFAMRYTRAVLLPSLRHPQRTNALVHAMIMAATTIAASDVINQAVGEVLAAIAHTAQPGDSCKVALEWAEQASPTRSKLIASALVAFGGHAGCIDTSSRALAVWQHANTD